MPQGQVTTREAAIDLLEGYATDRRQELEGRRLSRALVKSYLLETVPPELPQPDLDVIFRRAGAQTVQLDETFFLLRDTATGQTKGFLEKFDRHPVIFTDCHSREMDPWIEKLVQSNPEMDNLWLSGVAFGALLEEVCATNPPHRFGRVVFDHESLFDADSEQAPDADDEESEPVARKDTVADSGDDYIPERRSTRFMVVDRLGELEKKLPKLRAEYSPLHAIAQLRIPASGPGGHDFYYWGKATNRSNSFANHRQNVMHVLDLYRAATRLTETTAWSGVERTSFDVQGEHHVLVGAPATIEFSEPLPQRSFDNFVHRTFERERNAFRLWGHPIRLGPRKVHVYGLDRHLWQPIHLEITDRRIVAILPKGTCGNSIHRLVTNVQKHLDPHVAVWVGDTPYEQLIRPLRPRS